MKIIVYIIFSLDKVLYNVFGVVTPIRRAYWCRKAKELQKALDYQHKIVDNYNSYAADKMTGRFYVEHYQMLDSVNAIKNLDVL